MSLNATILLNTTAVIQPNIDQLNVPGISGGFPVSFSLFVLLFALVVIYYLLWSGVVCAKGFLSKIFEKLLKWSLGNETIELKIGSFGIAFLNGFIQLNDVEYRCYSFLIIFINNNRTNNICVALVQVVVRWNWFIRKVAETAESSLPPRLVIELRGAEFVFLHNR